MLVENLKSTEKFKKKLACSSKTQRNTVFLYTFTYS